MYVVQIYKTRKIEKYEILSVVACDLQLTSNIFEDCFENMKKEMIVYKTKYYSTCL